jgi:hypothetical protein
MTKDEMGRREFGSPNSKRRIWGDIVPPITTPEIMLKKLVTMSTNNPYQTVHFTEFIDS